ncbi:MAG TPA: glutamate--cysteine ligase [Kineosporiaceae bacterium]|nr:glutamate--cysteine ligase [Kineosporiaceae bacterium]
MTVRTVGVEEEFLLVDVATGLPAAAADSVAAWATAMGQGGTIDRELTLQQVETATGITTDLAGLRAELVQLRRGAAEAAAAAGTVLLATGTSPVPVSVATTPSPRYHRMTEMYGLTAREQLTCGCHVHVAVASDEEGVAALDRMRPWLAPLVALAANSPFWQGKDTAYASYRSRVWGRWPSAGSTAVFGSVDGYRDCVAALLESGTILDEGMVYFDVRLSHRYPTVEIRVADVALDVDDAVLVAALAAALVETAVQEWKRGVEPITARTELIRLATWRASRSGLDGELVDVLARRPVPAAELLLRLVEHVGPALEDAGRLDDVRQLVAQVLGRGTGAARQRAAYRRSGRIEDVVLLLAEQTLHA